MSVSFDKKADGAARRQARIQKEQKEKKKIRIITISVVTVLVLLFAGALFLNSKYARRNLDALTIGGVKFTAVDFDYFYNASYQQFRKSMTDQWGDYADSLLPDPEKSLSSQVYDPNTGETWAEFFVDYAMKQMTETVQYYNAAKEAGYVLPDEERTAMDNDITEFKQYVELYSTFDSYLQKLYGMNINESCFRKINEFINTANSYCEYKHDSFSYNAGTIADYYLENSDMLDIYTYRYFLVNMETVTESDYENTDEYEAAKEAALNEASERAALIAADIETEDDFINAAREYNETSYEDPDSTLHSYPGSWLGSYYGPWMRDNVHEYGDITTSDMSNGTYIVFFIGRDDNSYRMTEMRQILISRGAVDPDDYDEGENDPAYIEAVEAADTEARERAENTYNTFIDGGATEALLIDMLEDYSDDKTEGGFYDQISKDGNQNKMVPEIEDWLFENGRAYGDYALIRTADYGYHLVFFMGYGEKYSDFLADHEMRDKDYSAWKEGLPEAEAVRHWAFTLTQH